jgi:hypothetical protein
MKRPRNKTQLHSSLLSSFDSDNKDNKKPMKSILFVGKNRILAALSTLREKQPTPRVLTLVAYGSFYTFPTFVFLGLLSTCPISGIVDPFSLTLFQQATQSVYIMCMYCTHTHIEYERRGMLVCTTEFKGWRQTMVDLRQTIARSFFSHRCTAVYVA